jgi:hypothetical protein
MKPEGALEAVLKKLEEAGIAYMITHFYQILQISLRYAHEAAIDPMNRGLKR